jgi:hypothetical protein
MAELPDPLKCELRVKMRAVTVRAMSAKLPKSDMPNVRGEARKADLASVRTGRRAQELKQTLDSRPDGFMSSRPIVLQLPIKGV